jgi:Family of unknown function (DUF6328)
MGSVLLMAPTAHHRIRFRERDKEALIKTANVLAIAGTVCIAVAMTASVFLVTDILFKKPVTGIVTGVVAGCFLWFWYGMPLLRAARH